MFTGYSVMYIITGIGISFAAGFLVARTALAARAGAAEEERAKLEQKLDTLGAEAQTLRDGKTRLETELSAERKALTAFKEQMSDHFKALSTEVARNSQQNFFELAEKSFKADQEKRETAVKGLIEPMHKNLSELQQFVSEIEKARNDAFSKLTQNIDLIRGDHDRLRAATSSLAQALRSPNKRGQWGEINLRRALEAVGMVENVNFVQQDVLKTENGALKPDVVINLPGGRSIVIDAKAPIDAFLDAAKDGISEDERKHALDRHADHVRKKIKDLGSKTYWANLDGSPEFVLMYLPGDAYYAAALESDPTLFEAGIDNKVFLMTPTTLMPTLRVIEHAWKQEKLAQNAKDIAGLGHKLYQRLCTFTKHLETMGNGLNTALNNYNKAVGSLEGSVMPTARKFREYQSMAEDNALPAPAPIDKMPRQLQLTEHEEQDLKKAENG